MIEHYSNDRYIVCHTAFLETDFKLNSQILSEKWKHYIHSNNKLRNIKITSNVKSTTAFQEKSRRFLENNIDSSVYSEFDPFHPFKLHAIVAQFVSKITKIAFQTSTNGTSIHSIEMRPFEDDFSRFVLNESWERIAVMTVKFAGRGLGPHS